MKNNSTSKQAVISTFKILTLFFFGINIPLVKSQTFSWVKSVWATQNISTSSIASDQFGNVYYTGSFMGDADFDPGSGSAVLNAPNSSDVFLCKLDSAGSFVWVKQFTGPWDDLATKVTLDNSGNIYLSVQFYDSLDCNAGPDTNFVRSYGGNNGAVIKLNSNAEYVWATPFGGALYSIALDLKVNATNEVFLCGRFQGASNFGNIYHYIASNNSNIFVAKLDANGGFLWANNMGAVGATLDQARALAIDVQNNVYTTGFFKTTAEFDTVSFTSAGAMDIFITKHDNFGNLLWAKQIASTTEGNGTAIGLDALNNVYVGGEFNGSVDADPGSGIFNLSSNGVSDILVLKLDSLGNFIWAKKYGSTYADLLRTLTTNDNGDVLVSGIFSTTVDFNPDPGITHNLVSLGYNDTFIQMLDSTGAFVWVKQIGGIGAEEPRQIIYDNFGNILLNGFFAGVTDFDPGAGFEQLTSVGTQDVFVLKLSNQTLTALKNGSAPSFINIFPNPASDFIYLNWTDNREKTQVEVFDLSGKSVLSVSVNNSNNFALNVSEFSKGIYTLMVKNELMCEVKKIVIK